MTDPIILWCGRFAKSDGYGTVSKNHLRGLDLLGARVAALDLGSLSFVGPTAEHGLEISGRSPVTIRAKDPDDQVVVVFHERPDQYPRIRVDGRARLIGHSVFETDSLPPGWAESMVAFDEIWAPTEFNRASFSRAGVPPFLIETLPHSLDTDLYRSDLGRMAFGDEGDVVFLTVCSGLQRRDLGLAFRSFLRAFSPDSSVRFVVKLRDSTEALTSAQAVLDQAIRVVGGNAAQMAEKVELLPAHFASEQMIRLYQSCDVYVSVERANGWDLPTMESMACGRTTIGYHTGGSTEYTNDDVALRLPVLDSMVPIESTEAHEFYTAQWWPAVDETLMTEAMARAMDPGLRDRIGHAAAEHIREHFDVRVVSRQIVDFAGRYGSSDLRSHTRATVVVGNTPVWRKPGRPHGGGVRKVISKARRELSEAMPNPAALGAGPVATPDAPAVPTRSSTPTRSTTPTRPTARKLARVGVRVARAAKAAGVAMAREVVMSARTRSGRGVLAPAGRGLEEIRNAEYDPHRVWTDDDLTDRRAAFGAYPLISLRDDEREALRSLHNRYLGERCFVMGNGPSLNDTDLSKLADEYTFGVNKIYLLFDRIDWRPTFYTLLDWRVGPEIAPHIEEVADSIKFFPNRFRGILPPGDSTYWYTTRPVLDHIDDQFRANAVDGVPSKGTIVVTAIQLAFHLGFRDINLIGVDASYSIPSSVIQSGPDKFGTGVKLNLESTADDDRNHFDPSYFGKGAKWHDPNVDEMVRQFRQMRKGVEYHGGRIRNATVGGNLEVFERVDFDSLF